MFYNLARLYHKKMGVIFKKKQLCALCDFAVNQICETILWQSNKSKLKMAKSFNL